jgi:antitoxin MazE
MQANNLFDMYIQKYILDKDQGDLMPAVRAQLVKWGNSQAVRIPKTVVEQAHLQEGDELKIHAQEGRITIESVSPKVTLGSLVAGITRKNRHPESDWSKPVGKEVW